MEGCTSSLFNTGVTTVKKKRSKISRWPRCESSTVSRDEKTGFNLNHCDSNFSSVHCEITDAARKRIRNDDKVFGERDCCNGHIGRKDAYKGHPGLQSKKVDPQIETERNDESRSLGVSHGSGNQNNIRKVMLKIGGVTRTIHTNSTSDGATVGGMKFSCTLDAQSREKLSLQDTPDSICPSKTLSCFQGVPWRDFSGGNFSLRKEVDSEEKMARDSVSGRKTDKSEPVRKSRRVPKRRVLDEFDEEEEDDEIRYLEKMRRLRAKDEVPEEESKHRRKVSRVSKGRRVDHECVEDLEFSSASSKDSKKSRSEGGCADTYVEEEEPALDGLTSDGNKESFGSIVEAKKELSLTRRQQAIQSGKDGSTSLIEFPNGLPPAPSRKQKEKLSEVDQQLKKVEAAQRRKLQVEKQARESEAEAIRKILGQDSSRKKREDKLKKRRDELAQEKDAKAKTLPPNTVRWVTSPSGTVVTFSEDIGLPSIFTSKPCSYPPPREKCAGPSCTNPYVYRDSKSKLPLCSLKCYKFIREQSNILT